MGIQTGKEARKELKELLDQGHNDQRFASKELPDEFTKIEPNGWLWKAGRQRPGLRDPKAYEGLAPEGSDLAKILHMPPAKVLRQENVPESATDSPRSPTPYDDAQSGYLRKSIDVTMKGGVASGVIYPLALCELAREFRIRNVGGASAGAIAASFAAAAELGRARPTATQPPIPTTAEFVRTSPQSKGRCRRGYVGLADMIAWLTQVDGDSAKEEFRTAQLFKPTGVTLPVFRLLAAIMRSRFWAIPFLLATSFGKRMRYATLAFLIVLPLVLVVITGLVRDEFPVHWAWAWAVTAVWMLALSVTLYGLVWSIILSAAILRARKESKNKEAPAGLEVPIPEPEAPPRKSPTLSIVVSLLGVVILVGVGTQSQVIPWLGYPISLLTWLIGILVVLGAAIASLLRLLGNGKLHRYGLIGGRTRETDHKWLNSTFSRLMGMPQVTVDVNLTNWLDQCLSDLSGTTEVLRFGHLWNNDYAFHRTGSTPADELHLAASNARHRVVNLELMATELVHRVPYRFPLDVDDDLQWYFRKEDLVPIFPERVIDALCARDCEPNSFTDVETGDPVSDLYRLPDPQDLPVVFAVRISMAFPGLFEAIRLYRRATTGTLPVVRDDFGAPIAKSDTVLTYPQVVENNWIQELWFSDGGIASNFPIHFFDSIVPRWPTVGINLGPHPKGFGHQDVYLPTDRQATQGVPATMGPSVLSLFAALFDTARNWRDTAQTFMPATRGRIAWIRQRNFEGGLNLFMTRDTIATLALRGAVAGARLRRRFTSQGQWQRHQWLRLRVGLGNLARLQTRVQEALRDPLYLGLSKGPASKAAMQAIFDLLGQDADPTPAGANPFLRPPEQAKASEEQESEAQYAVGAYTETQYVWYEPDDAEAFWTSVQQTLRPSADAEAADEILNSGVPKPAAELRQVPAR